MGLTTPHRPPQLGSADGSSAPSQTCSSDAGPRSGVWGWASLGAPCSVGHAVRSQPDLWGGGAEPPSFWGQLPRITTLWQAGVPGSLHVYVFVGRDPQPPLPAAGSTLVLRSQGHPGGLRGTLWVCLSRLPTLSPAPSLSPQGWRGSCHHQLTIRYLLLQPLPGSGCPWSSASSCTAWGPFPLHRVSIPFKWPW